jgi:aspartyl protease family protein
MRVILIYKQSAITLLLLCILSSHAFADTSIFYRGIRAGKAWIHIDNRLAKLNVGQTSHEGIKLLSANKESMTVLFEGKRYRFNKNNKKGVLLDNEVELYRNPLNENFYGKGAINNEPAIFIIDTGASFVVLNKSDANKLNIPFGKKVINVSTASQDEKAYLVTLKSIQVGSIEIKDIEAVITNNNHHPKVPLLGMSFLKNVRISQTADKMVLIY